MVAFPVLAIYARSQGAEVLRVPEVASVGNSQTMSLLESYLNINPTGAGGVEIAIVDGTALESTGGEGEFFVDLGKSGNGQISVYIVRKGDTLSEIAEMFGVSSNTIIWANNIRGTSLKVGQELVILPISGVRHIVKSGDTLRSITKKYKADLEDILAYNDLLTDSKLVVGDIVIIPDGVMSAPSSVAVRSPKNQVSASAGYYLRPINNGVKSQGIHGYNGVDLAPSCRCQGGPVFASAAGTVLISKTSGYNGGYGLYVVIKHDNGTQTLYGHLSKTNVAVGQMVERGQVIGAIGNTGRSTGPHLHFEIRGARNPF